MLGKIVAPSSQPRHFGVTEDLAAAPAHAIREVIPRGDEPRSWKMDRRENGKLEKRFQLFNMALSIFRSCKPYYVRKGTRETCLCVYHLRWDLMVEGLPRYFLKSRRSIRNFDSVDDPMDSPSEEELSEEEASSLLELLRKPGQLRSKLMCETESGCPKFECLEGRCPRCRNFRKVEEVLRVWPAAGGSSDS